VGGARLTARARAPKPNPNRSRRTVPASIQSTRWPGSGANYHEANKQTKKARSAADPVILHPFTTENTREPGKGKPTARNVTEEPHSMKKRATGGTAGAASSRAATQQCLSLGSLTLHHCAGCLLCRAQSSGPAAATATATGAVKSNQWCHPPRLALPPLLVHTTPPPASFASLTTRILPTLRSRQVARLPVP
jgi:hypothetical protein